MAILLGSESPSCKCAKLALWQQATIKITRRDHYNITYSRHLYVGVVLRVHSVRVETRIQRNAIEKVATILTTQGLPLGI